MVQHRRRHADRPQPVLHPGTGEPVGPDDLAPLFPLELLQEVSEDAEIAIPDAVRNIYRLWRPTPLYRAQRLEAELGTRSRIFYKYEGVSPAGSHKPNTAVASGDRRARLRAGRLPDADARPLRLRLRRTSQLTPLVPMHTLGHDFVPPGIHAGGLRYHGMAPLVSQLVLDGLVRAEAYGQTVLFGSAARFARVEGIIPAPESAHAIHGVMQAAAQADEEGRELTVLFNLSGHGHFDLGAYDAYLHGQLEDFELSEDEIARALTAIEPLPKPAGI